MSGYCEVRFSVDERGYSFNHFTSCTDYVFCYESKKAVSSVLFKPAVDDNGQSRVRTEVVYPLEYVMHRVDPGTIDRDKTKPCRKRAIS